jgi:hypothetical protein
MFSASKTAGPSGYNLTNSLRFRSSASAYLNRTPGVTGNQRTWTFSAWVKRGALSGGSQFGRIMSTQGSFGVGINFMSDDTLRLYFGGSSTLQTTQVFRDPSAWYHVVVALDTTQATAANRVKLYVNGTQVTAFSSATYPSLNDTFGWNNSSIVHQISASTGDGATAYFDGYMDEINAIDGQALTPSSFGSTNATTGVWQPARYTGTYGTNGFYLNFTDIGLTSGANTGLGKDFSGNANYWTTNNISVTAGTTYDAMSDVPTLTSATVANYAVMNPLGNAVGNAPATLSEANLTCKNTATSYLGALGTIGLPTSGKFYWEVQLTQNSGPSNLSVFGIAPSNIPLTGNQANYANSISWYLGNNTLIQLPSTGTVTAVSGGSTTSDVFQICYDGSTGKVYLGRNNTFYNSAGSATGNPSSGTNETTTLTTGDLLPWFFAYQEGATFNFGQRPFTYTPPTGFVRLNTFNLPDSTIKKGNSYMNAVTYTGSASNVTVTSGFYPDLTWAKSRNNTYNNSLVDSNRGGNSVIFSNSTSAQSIVSGLATFSSTGVTYLTGASGVNADASTNYILWAWNAGSGTNTTNTAGSITTTTSVSTTAGFSIIQFTGTQANATIGHGLGVAPKMVIVKTYGGGTRGWRVYHASVGNTGYLILNDTATTTTDSTAWNNTTPTSTVISLGANGETNNGGSLMIAYAWAEIAGFSKFGSYTGNGSADGPFVYLGFRPKYVLVKASSNAENWYINDSARDTFNPDVRILAANTSDAEFNNGSTWMDLTSNGFKIRYNTAPFNTSGATYIYMAFAENPLKNSLAR